jgi:6-pyruvoyltetrahydropterin/6-carboxytetrahydropterin synthase
VIEFLSSIKDHRTVIFAEPPTAEHLAATALQILEKVFTAAYGERIKIEQVRLYETPNCWADATPA